MDSSAPFDPKLQESSKNHDSLGLPTRELTLLFDNMISPFSYYKMLYDADGNPEDYVFLAVNHAFEQETGRSREQVLGRRVLEVFPQTEKYWIEQLGQVAKTGNPARFSNYARALNNWYEIQAYSPQPDHFALTVHNVSEAMESRRQLLERIQQLETAENKLSYERELLRTTLLSIADGVICTDRNGCVTIINEAAKRLTGWRGSSAIGRSCGMIFQTLDEYTRERQPAPCGSETSQENRAILLRRDGSQCPISYRASHIRRHGRADGVVLVFRDETELRHKQAKIEFMGFHDQLTGLYNRHFFESQLISLSNEMRLPLTVLMCDLNGLKLTNDAFGHGAGDELLVKFSEILKAEMRQEDVVSRYGGDEFTVILPRTDYAAAAKVVARIGEAIRRTTFTKGMLSVAFGWETKTDTAQDIFLVLKQAEDHMYKNKLIDEQRVRSSTIQTVLNTLYEKSAREALHSARVGKICQSIGEKLCMGEQELHLLMQAGRLHDVGKIILLNGILDKPGALNSEEWAEVHRHPEIGYRILNNTAEFADISQPVLEHHERWDGSGYPKGLTGESISLPARVIAVADTFDAMTVARPYRSAVDCGQARAEIQANAEKQFDPDVVKVFLALGDL